MKQQKARSVTIARSLAVMFVAMLCVAPGDAQTPRAAANAVSDPNATPQIALAGSSPVAGCPEFFEYMSATDVNVCAEQMDAHGWGLSAVTLVRYPLMFAGAFAPHMPKREVEGRYGFGDSALRRVIRLFGGIDSNWTYETEAGPEDTHCGDVRLYEGGVGGNAAETATRAAYVAAVSQEAAKGCVPADEARVSGQEDESGTEDALFVPGNPKTYGSLLYGSKADVAAFEARAAARGFQPLLEKYGFELWGLTRAHQRLETIRVSDMGAHWRAASANRERLTSIAYENDAAGRASAVLIWSK